MLVLSRKKNESIIINGNVTVTVTEIRGDKVRIALLAPRDIIIDRLEVHNAKQKESSQLREPDGD